MNNLSFTPYPILETTRLQLRQIIEEDADQVFALRSDKAVSKYIDRAIAKEVKESVAFIQHIDEGVRENKWVNWAITLKGRNKLIGTICLWNFIEKPFKADLGYELLPTFQGKGIMAEALKTVIQYGFKTLNLHMIEAQTNAFNASSIKLLENAGFIRERFFEEEHSCEQQKINMVVYALRNFEPD